MVTVEIAGDGEDLGDGCELMPATRVAHFPTEPVYTGGQGQTRGVVGGCGEAYERFCEWIGLVPPRGRAHSESLMHVEDGGGVNSGAQEDEFFLDVLRQDKMCWLDGGFLGRTNERRRVGVDEI